ncbi:MAG TPA: metallophosphoesterase, partial [Ktedonobacteraceae bacterium]|nr:metallophosphoesterase [Ktedonobacteraceae bacterium]
MRIALLSDIHGNTLALDAVLADIAEQGEVDRYWILGDFSSLGYDPVGVLERITKLPNVSFVRGNHDRYTVTGERPGPTLE